ncbi:uracil-DNA glycosylase [Hyphomicrobiales bacterium]|nr:uracil-DNA glycosylase [Rhodobiaceae bacterium]MBT5640777.1 uracil-DNA glycosylase [Rhodobiaceae bacterium]MBT6222827.1 uracil-DNA glycosylase [Rhodobiaceae bacterium]MDB4128323.1 uracil-DNA glycosylase [Hyphomicrobiales bacterium]
MEIDLIKQLYLLKWYEQEGIYELVKNQPINRTQNNDNDIIKNNDTIIDYAAKYNEKKINSNSNIEKLIANVANIEELESIIKDYDLCHLKAISNKTCFKEGNTSAKIILVSDYPKADDDLSGRIFSGLVSDLLVKMLISINLSINDVYMTNIIYWRTPGDRNPSDEEIILCKPFLERQIEILKPKIIITLGEIATNVLLNKNNTIMQSRGTWHSFNNRKIEYPVMPMLHPSYLLRQPAQKKLAWHDLLLIKDKIDELNL